MREISGRYKFGEEFALSIDGAGVHAHAPGSPFGHPSACAFTRKLGGAGPFAAELQAVRQPPGGCLFVITEGLFVIRIHVFYRILPVFYPYSTHFPKLTVFYRIHQERTRIHKNTQEYEHVEEGERHILRK